MTRVLVIGMHNRIGGVETFLMNYYRNIDKNKIQFDFINMYDKICFEDEIKRLGGTVYKVPNVKKNPIGYYFEIINIIKKNEYKIVHINMLSMANILPVLAAKKANTKKIIIHSHNSNTPKGIYRKYLNLINKFFVLKWATDLWACSKLAGEWMFGKNKRFTIINNAIEIEKFKFDNEIRIKMRKKLKIEEKFVIGHIGRFSEQKNHQFLLQIAEKVFKENKQAILLSIGEGELKKDIIQKAKGIKISDKIIFLEPVNNVNDYLQAMDVFVLPSKFEGLPVVAVEAQDNGLPVITSETVSTELPIKELSVYCSLNNLEEWVNKIQNIKIDRKDRRKDITKSNYNIKEEVRKIEELYQS